MRDIGIHHIRLIVSVAQSKPIKHYMHCMGFRDYSKEEPEYIEGTLSVSVKYNKEELFPIAFLGNFLPDPRLVKTELGIL
jgi:hypothetical protein